MLNMLALLQETGIGDIGAGMAVLGAAGDLVGLDGWLQTDATQFSDFDGSVRVVQFWTFSCSNCKNTLENLRDSTTSSSHEVSR